MAAKRGTKLVFGAQNLVSRKMQNKKKLVEKFSFSAYT